jgi:hypothetical protein
MRTLELFAGTQSFSKAVRRASAQNITVTVDILPKFGPTIIADIHAWDPTVYGPGYFDVVWCSPPCEQYSKARTTGGPRDLVGADQNVLRCLELIDYFQPRVWIIENPQTGLLPGRMEVLRPRLPFYDVDYCAYGKAYRKRTRIWSNVPFTFRLCGGAGVCPSMDGTVHRGSCGNTTARYNAQLHAGLAVWSVWEKDAMPAALCDDIVRGCELLGG